ncbi:MAG: 3-phosphoshikimate 1-carboxyvinyltransferase [Candidatus Competibacterales bacterium]
MAHSQAVAFIVEPSQCLQGRLPIPGDKSISHRAIMLGALADGETAVDGFLNGADCLATLEAFKRMGVAIQGPGVATAPRPQVVVKGVGVDGLKAPDGPLDMGNAGTAMRLMAGLLAGQPFDSVLVGDASLSKRPMGRITEPLRAMGAVIDAAPGERAPLAIRGGQTLTGIHYPSPLASAQVKSCLLLAGLYAQGRTAVTEPAATRDHTERMLMAFGYDVERRDATAALTGGGRLTACPLEIPADVSSAAFFLVGASIAPGSEVVLERVGTNPTRAGIIALLQAMGADLTLENQRVLGAEPVADIRVRSAALRGIEIPETLVPLAIDEFPALFVAAAVAKGETVLKGAQELRVKESDRIQAMADGLNALGADTTPTADGMVIRGKPELRGGRVDSLGDHRVAMALAMAGLRAAGEVHIDDCANVATSFPGFVDVAHRAGLSIRRV